MRLFVFLMFSIKIILASGLQLRDSGLRSYSTNVSSVSEQASEDYSSDSDSSEETSSESSSSESASLETLSTTESSEIDDDEVNDQTESVSDVDDDSKEAKQSEEIDETEVASEADETEVAPEADETEVAPEANETEVAPEADETEVAPEADETEVASKADETEVVSEANKDGNGDAPEANKDGNGDAPEVNKDGNGDAPEANKDKTGVAPKANKDKTGFTPEAISDNDEEDTKQFKTFIQNHKRSFKTQAEYQKRFEHFKKSLQELNAIKKEQRGTAEFGITKFMDWSPEEKAKLTGARSKTRTDPNLSAAPIPSRFKRSTPTSYDWRTSNKVTPVKDQGQCGSCWAFASIAVTESAIAINTNQLLDLSEQNLVNCVTQSYGCDGGWPPYGLVYTRTSGVATEAAYPYTGTDGTCKAVTGSTFITDWWYVGTDETQLTSQLVARGPLLYTIWVPDSMFYLTSSSGVYKPTLSECNTAAKNGAGHAITVVGYGVDSVSKYPYWLIKNSWGTSWGDAGYFKLYRGSKLCSMGNSMWAATVSGSAWTCGNQEDEDNCKYWAWLGYCSSKSKYYKYTITNCKAACGLCSSG